MATYIYEYSGGKCYGYFQGKYLYTMNGKCTHYLSGSDNKYLYAYTGGQCEFYRSGKYFYEYSGGKCRWYMTQDLNQT